MYEKRKYGSKIRYRVTEAMSNDKAKSAAARLRADGYGCQVDTWKGQFAVWCDKRIERIGTASRPRKRATKTPSRRKPRQYGTLEGPEFGGWQAISMTDYDSKMIVAVRSKVGGQVYQIVERGSKKKILRKYKEYTDSGYSAAIIRFKDTWALGEKEWSGAAGRKYGSKTPKSQVTTVRRKKVSRSEVLKLFNTIQPKNRNEAIAHAQFTFNITKKDAGIAYTSWRKKQLGSRGVAKDIDMSEPKTKKRKRQLKSPIKVVPSSKLPLGINVIMECREGTSNKFWGWHIPPPTRGRNIVDLYWGRIDAKTMRRQQRKFGDKEELEAFLSKKFNEKQRKGYKVSR